MLCSRGSNFWCFLNEDPELSAVPGNFNNGSCSWDTVFSKWLTGHLSPAICERWECSQARGCAMMRCFDPCVLPYGGLSVSSQATSCLLCCGESLVDFIGCVVFYRAGFTEFGWSQIYQPFPL